MMRSIQKWVTLLVSYTMIGTIQLWCLPAYAVNNCDVDLDREKFQWVRIPAGPYTYGKSGNIQKDIPYDFFIMKHEVTNGQYVNFLKCMLVDNKLTIFSDTSVGGSYRGDRHWNAGPREFLDLDDSDCRIYTREGHFFVKEGYADHPVLEVSWFGANAFAEYYGYKLPTERAWEKSARGDTESKYPWGNEEPDCLLANSFECSRDTRPVGQTTGLSPFGVTDMAGNVAEWTRSFHHPKSHVRVVKGGDWMGFNGNLLIYRRENETPVESTKTIGFRCVKLR